MNEASLRELCRRYASGVPIAELVADYGRSVSTIKGLLSTHLHNGKFRKLSDIRRTLKKSHPDERWKPLNLPTKTSYAISDYGRIKNLNTGEQLGLRIGFGYFSFEYTDQILKKKKSTLVHILVARHWMRQYDPEQDIVHLDFDNFNNHYRNLRQVTLEERARRRLESDRGKRYKLTAEIVKQIKSSKASPTALAERFQVSTMQVLRVQRGDCWAHILPNKTRARQPTPSTPPKTVARIKAMLAKGKSGKSIAEKLNVTETTVSRIKRGKTYKTES